MTGGRNCEIAIAVRLINALQGVAQQVREKHSEVEVTQLLSSDHSQASMSINLTILSYTGSLPDSPKQCILVKAKHSKMHTKETHSKFKKNYTFAESCLLISLKFHRIDLFG